MEKMILWIVISALVLSITGCFSDSSESPNTKTDEKLVVSLIIPDQLGDKSFFDSAHAGMLRAEEELNIESWMIAPFKSKIVEKRLKVESWMTAPFEAGEFIEMESWMYSSWI